MESRYKILMAVAIGMIVGVVGSPAVHGHAKKKQVARVTQVRVTAKKVQGKTTKGAKVVVLTTKNRILGQGEATSKGAFTIKVRKNLKKATFKFKVTKKGYVSRTTVHKYKLPQKPVVTNPVAPEVEKPTSHPNNGQQLVTAPSGSKPVDQKTKKILIRWAKDKIADAEMNLQKANEALEELIKYQQNYFGDMTWYEEQLREKEVRLDGLNDQKDSDAYKRAKEDLEQARVTLAKVAEGYITYYKDYEEAHQLIAERQQELNSRKQDLANLLSEI
ncbi:Ig-like domain-containing protein [Levilactobacillus spicheri]|uniref:Bacterial Ig domain-containing protein n=2 Tax=Levilactobacillus spicheri TaxID=216463 RepID=A0ABQ0WQB5_9LACO|nr:Ig-like domain-containing protein [Levilactobacillus spicheri]KRL47646.1 hypothetical protein FD37_GL001906 [Levilactobacillus spicheri DSM 15429]GEO67226.1 hypothetical protein LSP04_16450 [Levilactobacillus spicheri]